MTHLGERKPIWHGLTTMRLAVISVYEGGKERLVEVRGVKAKGSQQTKVFRCLIPKMVICDEWVKLSR